MSSDQGRSLEQMPPQSNFAAALGIEIDRITAEEVVCRMRVTEEMTNRNGVLHGGALMTLADNAAGTVAFMNCPLELSNVTIEAKTNFMRAVTVGDTVTATGTALHRGRTTLVLQVTLTRGDGKVVGVTTQTHLVLGFENPS